MRNEILVIGKQVFMGKEIPVIEGGFGKGKKCICDKTIAEIHRMKTFHVRELLNNNIKRFKENIDFIDLKQRIGVGDILELLQELGYAKQSITQAAHIYLLSERGYAKLIKIMDTDLAWEIHDKLINEYFTMRDNIIPKVTELASILESEILGIKDEFQQSIEYLSNKIDIISGSQRKIHLDYVDCLSGSDANMYRNMSDDVKKIIDDIQNYGGYESGQKVFSKIYEIMKCKCGIDVNKCRKTFIFEHPSKQKVSPWFVILSSPILYKSFYDIATEMLNQLTTYGCTSTDTDSDDFEETRTELKKLAKDKYNSNVLLAYKNIYKCMEDIFGLDWTGKNINGNKSQAVKADKELQNLFVNAIEYLQCNDI